MNHPTATARLVEPGGLEGRGVTAVLDRAAIEETLRSEGPDELLLDVARGSNGEVEAHVVRVDLGREDLERILTQTPGDRVALDFDGTELEAILDEADVEGHGLREKALVLSVAAVTAAGAAGGASGAIPNEGGGSQAPFGAVAASAGEAPATVTGAAGAEEAPFGAVAASAGEAPAAVTGAAGAEEAPFGAVAASAGEAPAAVTGAAGAEEAPFGAVAASAGEAPAAVTGAAGQPEPGATPVDRVAPQPRGGGSALETSGSPDPAVLAGVAGGLGLLAITAAAFARRREQEPRFS